MKSYVLAISAAVLLAGSVFASDESDGGISSTTSYETNGIFDDSSSLANLKDKKPSEISSNSVARTDQITEFRNRYVFTITCNRSAGRNGGMIIGTEGSRECTGSDGRSYRVGFIGLGVNFGHALGRTLSLACAMKNRPETPINRRLVGMNAGATLFAGGTVGGWGNPINVGNGWRNIFDPIFCVLGSHGLDGLGLEVNFGGSVLFIIPNGR